MSYTQIINSDKSFPQGRTMEELQCYISTELGKQHWTFFTLEDETYSWFKKDFHLRINFWKKVISVTELESTKEIIFRRCDNWKTIVYDIEKELS